LFLVIFPSVVHELMWVKFIPWAETAGIVS
jgi:hypothetical protein